MARNTQAKIDFILANYRTKTMSEMAEDLDTSISGVYYLGVKLGVINEMKRARLKPTEDGGNGGYEDFVRFIIDHHKDMTCPEMAAKLGCSHSRVNHYIKKFGLLDAVKRPPGAKGHRNSTRAKVGYFDADAVGAGETWLF